MVDPQTMDPALNDVKALTQWFTGVLEGLVRSAPNNTGGFTAAGKITEKQKQQAEEKRLEKIRALLIGAE